MTRRRDQSLTDELLARLEGLILDGHLKPGDHVRESVLAEEWGVSRAPIREVCRILQQTGLIEIVTNRGAFIRKVSLQEVLHLYDIRGTLWRLAAREATLNVTHRHFEHLELLIDQIANVVEEDDKSAYLELNSKFHNTILELSNNRPLIRLQRDLFLQARLFRRRALYSEAHLADFNEDHRRLLAIMRAGDPEAAGRISEEHVMKSKQRFIDALGVTFDPIGDVIEMDSPHAEILEKGEA